MRKAAGCVLLAILCLLGASYLPRILQEAQTDREQQNLISGYIQNPDTTDEENMILCQEKVQIKNDFFPSCQHT